MRPAGIAAALAVAYLGAAGAGSLDTALGPQVLPRAYAPALAVARTPRGHYVLHCAGCHRADGSGAPERYVPDLRSLGRFLAVDGGREFLIGVPGVMRPRVAFRPCLARSCRLA